jgi:SAM-dependent methyltransferase
MRLHPQPSPEELSKYYPADYWFAPDDSALGLLVERYRRFVLRDHLRFVTRALRESDEAGPVLDVGCGGGLFLGLLRERGFTVMGLDSSNDAAAVAWARHRIRVECGSLSHAPFPTGSCAAITMFHVLEHLYHPGSYIEAAHRLLRPHGRLIVQVPNAACWQFKFLGEMWNGIDIHRHLFDFRATDLQQLLDSCGFEVVRRTYFSLRDNPAGLATSLAPCLDPMARRIRGAAESNRARGCKDLLYLALVMLALPLTAVEAACGAGSTVMMEARKRP